MNAASDSGGWAGALDQATSTTRPRLFAHTELGNAERLVHWHGQDIRYCHATGTWYVWDGRRWAEDAGPQLQARIVDVLRSMVDIEGDLVDDDEELGKEELGKWARRSESARAIAAVQRLAGNMVAIDAGELDRHPMALNVSNGTIDLRTGELLEHRREDLLTRMLEVPYDPIADIPTWRPFVQWFVQEDQGLFSYLQRLAGYWLTGSTDGQQLAIFYGDGSNGKSTYLDVLRVLLGPYACAAPPRLLVDASSDEHPTELWTLRGRRLAIAAESRDSRKMDEEKVKRLTGSDPVSARRMHQDFVTFEPTHKLAVSLNHKPVITGTDHGIWRRIHLIPCLATVEGDDVDPTLPARLREELPGILAWAVRGCVAWQRMGLQPTPAMDAARDAYRAEMDHVGEFLDELCLVGGGYRVTSRELYSAYREWATERGERPRAQNTLGRELRSRGFEPFKDDAVRGFRGLVLRSR